MEQNIYSNSCQQTYIAEQVAEILGISVRKAYSLCENTKELKVIRLGKRCLRIHKESFDRWLNGEGALADRTIERDIHYGNIQNSGQFPQRYLYL